MMFPESAKLKAPMSHWTLKYRLFKRTVDLLFSLAVLPFVIMLAAGLLVINPIFNPGPVFFRQSRMGLGGVPFTIWKFRTMTPCSRGVRAHDAPVEKNRIGALGRFLRQTRIDELPNVFSILRGEMTLVGPRPDAWEHAVQYIDVIPYYRDRFRVKPGITGLAQVRAGYADTRRAVQRKARLDRFYVSKSRLRLDLIIMLGTAKIVLTGFGAK